MSLKSQSHRHKRERKMQSAGEVAGFYVKPERNSEIQFPCRFIGDSATDATLDCLNKFLSKLFSQHGEKKVKWYVERSFGLDNRGNVAWENLDTTDLVVP